MNAYDIQAILDKSPDVTVEYETIALGNGAPEEQESGILDLVFTGYADTRGSDVRFKFVRKFGKHETPYYIFADEIISIVPKTA